MSTDASETTPEAEMSGEDSPWAAQAEHFTEPAGATHPEAGQPEPVLEPGPERDQRNAALAAALAIRDEEVAAEIAAHLDGYAESDKAFLIGIDAHIAAARQSVSDYGAVAVELIHGRLDSASLVIGEICSPHRRAA
jgi:hypothetical protein